jgi:hypothetical protein
MKQKFSEKVLFFTKDDFMANSAELNLKRHYGK